MNVVTDYLRALREDLRDRRLLPLVVLAGVAMLGAIAFVVLGGSGGGSSSTTASTGPAVPLGRLKRPASRSRIPPPRPRSPRPQPEPPCSTRAALATRSRCSRAWSPPKLRSRPRTRTRRARAPRVPAARPPKRRLELGTVLVGQRLSSSGSSSSGSSGSSGSSSEGSSKSGGSSGGKGSGGKSGGSKPSQPKTVYDVSVLFGEVTPGSTAPGSGLTPYENLKLFTPLPSKEEPLVVFRGVTKGGKTATFTVAAETILQGDGKCLPSAIQCEAVQLHAGQTEQLQYLKAGTENVQSYELHLVSITSTAASKASVASIVHAQSKAGIEVLRRANLIAIPGLGMSSLAGVLVPTS